MTFGDRDGSGGFVVSPGAIINTVAAAAMGAIALMVIGNNSDIASLKISSGDQALELRRLESTETAIDQTLTTILGNQRGLEDANASDAADYKRLHEEQQDLRKQISDLEHSLAPPRNGR